MKLLVAASPLELQAFDENIDGFDRVTTGIGKVHAAVGLTQALERGTYDEIVVVGTSGAVDPAVEGRVHDISRVIQHDVHNDGVIGEHVSMPAFIDLGREGLTIATGDSFIDDAVVAAKVRELGATMLDMESFVYAWVAQHYGVPIRISRIASDSAQDGATKLWDEVVAECSVELWDWFRGEYLS